MRGHKIILGHCCYLPYLFEIDGAKRELRYALYFLHFSWLFLMYINNPLSSLSPQLREVFTWKLNILLFFNCFFFCLLSQNPKYRRGRGAQPERAEPAMTPASFCHLAGCSYTTRSMDGFSSMTYVVFPSCLMKDPMITGNITHRHWWACPDTSKRSFPSPASELS